MSANPAARRQPASTKLVLGLALGMLVSGTSTSLWMKWQDMQCVKNCNDPDPKKHKTFEQPILQSETMFVGEMMCLLASVLIASPWNPYRPLRTLPPGPPIHAEAPPILEENAPEPEDDRPLKWSTRLLFAAPATLDILGTTSMNAALLWVPVSAYQMLKGALTLWVALWSFLFLGHRLSKAQLVSIAEVALGVATVGWANIQGSGGPAVSVAGQHPVAGVLIILLAQVFIASQFVIEEKIMERHVVEPLVAVGWEGVSGFIIIGIAMPVLHLLIGRTDAGRGGFFDAPNAIHELFSGPRIWGPAIIFAVSVAFTNFFGLQVTKNVSATARSTIDTCRTCSIWIVSLAMGWETLKYLQVVGFLILVHGTFVFNGIITYPRWTGLHDNSAFANKVDDSVFDGGRRRAGSASGGESAPLLSE